MGVAGVKYAMDKRGYYGGPVREPLLPLNETQKKEADSVLATLTTSAASA
jgi:dihydrodipicolinate synthase/N-acetylneuraminate lyase